MPDNIDRPQAGRVPAKPPSSQRWLFDDDEAFEMHTIDTGAAEADASPESPADTSALDDFVVVTVEPDIMGRPTTPPRPLAPPVPPARSVRRPVARPESARSRRQRAGLPVWFVTLRTLVIVLAAAVLISTIFSLWTRPTFFSDEFRAGLDRVQATQHLINIQPSPIPTNVREVRIGIIAGHSGPPQDASFETDPGAVCDDGLTELEINRAVAVRVVTALQRDEYTVELFEEFDPRLSGYKGDVLVSIHTNDCGDYGEAGTGYAVAAASSRQTTRDEDERLLECLIQQYGATTGLPHHTGLTYDMTEYHTFGEVSVDTPTAIIELGFMRNDRAVLTQQPDLLAQGIANGIRCFLRPELYGEMPELITH